MSNPGVCFWLGIAVGTLTAMVAFIDAKEAKTIEPRRVFVFGPGTGKATLAKELVDD